MNAPIPPAAAPLHNPHTIFCNRSLRLDQIDMVGFDMDYTLAIYHQPEVDRLSVEATVRKLVEAGYPPMLEQLAYRTDFAVRGLLVDRKLGNVLKMDRHRYVKRAYHGLRCLPRHERQAIYHTRHLKAGSRRYHWVDTLYSLSEVAVYAAVIEALEAAGHRVHFDRLFRDVRRCIDRAHQDGSILGPIAADLPRYLRRDDALGATLERFRQAGKRLFLLTNSPPAYTDRVMSYLLGDGTSGRRSWQSHFDILITAAGKPGFFTGRQAFSRTLQGAEDEQPGFVPGQVYCHGNIVDLERRAGIGGDRVLYVGDHIYGDVLRAKKDSAWRTVMIVQEMSEELQALQRSADDLKQLDAVEERLDGLYDQLRECQRSADDKAAEEHAAALRRSIDALEAGIAPLEERVDQRFHPFWGSVFKAGNELSSFGDQLEQYACLYTSRVSHFLDYSPMHYFRSPRMHLPHDNQGP